MIASALLGMALVNAWIVAAAALRYHVTRDLAWEEYDPFDPMPGTGPAYERRLT
jgi:hypothetical protein